MSNASRKRRGAEAQAVWAAYMRDNGWPHATDAGAGRAGVDILNVEEAAIEVRARRGLDLPGWLRQAVSNADGRLPVLVVRGDGQGPAMVDRWAFVVTGQHGLMLLHLVRLVAQLSQALGDGDDHETALAFVVSRMTDVATVIGHDHWDHLADRMAKVGDSDLADTDPGALARRMAQVDREIRSDPANDPAWHDSFEPDAGEVTEDLSTDFPDLT
jgi:hypothetical protein